MGGEEEIQLDCSPLFRKYKDGRIERLLGTVTVPPSFDPSTGVTSKDVTIDPDTDLSARLYLPNNNKKLPILVYYHGGGFCVESAFSPTYQPFLNTLSSQAELLIVSVNYHLAPEHVLPAAYDDSWAALRWVFSAQADPWLAEHGDLNHVFVAGDSAGANISHQMGMRSGRDGDDGVRIEGMALIHPYFWGSEPIGEETRDPGVRGLVERLWEAVNEPGSGGLDDERFSPKTVQGLGCVRVVVCVAERDIFAQRGRAYFELLRGGEGWGGVAEMFVTEGEEHVFHLREHGSVKAQVLMNKLVAFFSEGLNV